MTKAETEGSCEHPDKPSPILECAFARVNDMATDDRVGAIRLPRQVPEDERPAHWSSRDVSRSHKNRGRSSEMMTKILSQCREYSCPGGHHNFEPPLLTVCAQSNRELMREAPYSLFDAALKKHLFLLLARRDLTGGTIMRVIVICGAPPVQVLDVTGPLEVFSNVPGYEVLLVTMDGSTELKTNRGINLGSAVSPDRVSGPIDTLVVAGGPGAESGQVDCVYLRWISNAARRARRIVSICTGAFVLAAAGLLDGKRVVTHWKFSERLAREFPKLTVLPNRIFVRDGQIYTSAGITSGIDLSLALIEEDHGHHAAHAVARQLVMFLVRPGGQPQYSHMLSRQATTSMPLRELQVYMLENLKADLSVEALATRMGMSPRHFSRVCLRDLKMSPGEFVDRVRVEAAQQMIDSCSRGLKEIADACGFRSTDSMRRTFQRVTGMTAAQYMDRSRRAS